MRERKNKLFVLLTIVVMSFLYVPYVSAAGALSALTDTQTTIKASTASNHVIKFTTPTGVDAPTDTITLTFTSFTGTVTAADVTLSTGASTGLETPKTVAGSAASNVWGASWSSPTLTLTPPTNATTGEVVAGNKVVISVNNTKLTNPAAGTYVIDIGGNFNDAGKIAVAIITNDQVTVNATVAPSISMTVSANATDFSTLNAASINTSTPNITLGVDTNATSGYTIKVKDYGNNGTTPGLYSLGASTLIPSSTTTLAVGTPGYGIQASSAIATVNATYLKTSNDVGGLTTSFSDLSSYNGPTSSTQSTVVTHKAALSASTKAGSYTDTITYLVTGNF